MKLINISVIIILNLLVKSSLCENLKLLILHNNDMHSRFEEVSQTTGTCKDKSNCYGGFARVLHVIREARKAAADGTGPPVLYLNAGDTYTGTSWFSVHKWKIAADFMNLLHPDVASFGNHEFDHHPNGIVPFLNAINFPIVAANVDFSKEPVYLTTNVTKSFVLEVSGKKIGVIGYILPDTAFISSPGAVIFTNEVEAIKAESELLNSKGVKIIIALGHSGFKIDKEIAEKVPLVDLVIGGHTNTFLWNGPKPSIEDPEGPYPFVVTQVSGKKVPVVQAFAYTKYMGRLNVIFNDDGELVSYNGQPQLLNMSIPQDKDALVLLNKYRPAVDALSYKVVGTTRVHLDGELQSCRGGECNLANLVTDAFIEHYVLRTEGKFWTDVPIAIINAGYIRTGINSRFSNGSITMSDIMQALPFVDQLHVVTLNGSDLLETLEIGSRYDGDTNRGELIQSSGIRYTYDMKKPVGSRIVSARVRCGLCDVPKYSNIVMNQSYNIMLTDFLINGGDGHVVIKNKSYNRFVNDFDPIEIIGGYISRHSPIYLQEDERIIGLNTQAHLPSKSAFVTSSLVYITLSVVGVQMFR